MGVTVMDKIVRYHVLPDQSGQGVIILDAHTGRIQYPICWQDLTAYYHYLVGRGHIDEAQQLLADSMAGNKPITRMIQTQINDQYG